jgi:peptidoglycan/LPS O-acetylase OafA/YrhL
VNHIGALTVIRGLAAWWVVLYHFREHLMPDRLPWLNTMSAGGYLAVDLFFVLSGFVIALSCARYFDQGFTVATTRDFLVRRLARIYPLHLVMMVFYLTIPAAILTLSSAKTLNGNYEADYFLLALGLIHNWGFTDSLQWNVPSWSISTEWFAYVCFPALIWIANGRLTTLGRNVVAILVLGTIIAALFAIAGTASIGERIPQLGMYRCALEFAMGICVYNASRAVTGPRADRLANYAGALAIALSAVTFAHVVPDYASMPIAFAALIFSLSIETSAGSRMLNTLPLHTVGLISYSTYLSHYPIKEWVKLVLVRDGIPEIVPIIAYLGGVAVASVVLYRLVEVPGRDFVQRLGSLRRSPTTNL